VASSLLLFMAEQHPNEVQLQAGSIIKALLPSVPNPNLNPNPNPNPNPNIINKALLPSLGHQHAKVRIEILSAISAVSSCGRAPLCLFDNKSLFSAMHVTVYDRAAAVREHLVFALKRWLDVRATVSGGDHSLSSTLVHLHY